MDRIFTASHSTQLLVVQHVRKHYPRTPAREFLLWYPQEGMPCAKGFLESIVENGGFDATLDLRDLASLRPRRHSRVGWWFEAARRLRQDSIAVRSWLARQDIREEDSEVWTDDPIHFNATFLKGLLRKAVQVKYPHCFNLEDASSADGRARLIKKYSTSPWAKRVAFWPWLRAMSGCDLDPRHATNFDIGYTFDRTSPWAANSVDLSGLISLRHFEESFVSLPASLRADVEVALAPVLSSGRAVAVLLLFGLDSISQSGYRQSLSRLLAERGAELEGCVLGVKVHPGAKGVEEERFFDWAARQLPLPVFPIRSVLNLEFMLHLLHPKFVLAGPCGALPIVRRLKVGRAIVLREILEILAQRYPDDSKTFESLTEGMEVW